MTLHCLFWPYTPQSKHLFNFPLIHKNLYDIYTFRGDFSLSFHTFRGDFIWIHDNILVDLTKINQEGSEDITSIYITLCLSLCDVDTYRKNIQEGMGDDSAYLRKVFNTIFQKYDALAHPKQ